MRPGCQTERMARFPTHVVCEWLGNSKLIAQEIYVRVHEADFEQAAPAWRQYDSANHGND
jgi:hypothetical protein